MRVLVIGATGTIGSAVADALSSGHEVVRVGRSRGDLRVDVEDKASIDALYVAAGPLDAVVCAAGTARFGPLAGLTDEDYGSSFRNKLMGQANLVRVGMTRLDQGASFTLTTGNLSHHPEPGSAAVSMVGAGLESFVKAAALELKDRYRVNVVSPGWIRETRVALGMEPEPGTPAAEAARAYVAAVEGTMTGQVIEVP